MRPVFQYLAVAAAVVTTTPLALRAQDSTHVVASDSALLIDHTFNAPAGEQIHVFLSRGTTYRAELHGQGLRLQLRPLLSSMQSPLVHSVLGTHTTSASGETLYSIVPRADGEYLISTAGGDPGSPVKLRMYSVAPATALP